MEIQEFGAFDLVIRAMILFGVLIMSFSNFRTIRENRKENETMKLLKYYNNFFAQNIPLYSGYIAALLLGLGLFRIGSILNVDMTSTPSIRFFNIILADSDETLKNQTFIKILSFSGAVLFVSCCIMYNLTQVHIGRNYSLFIDIKEHYLLKTDRSYKLTRHPMYFVESLSYLTASIAMLSWALLLWTAAVHIPLLIYRAKAEEKLLEHYFGSKYAEYKSKVSFFIPGIK